MWTRVVVLIALAAVLILGVAFVGGSVAWLLNGNERGESGTTVAQPVATPEMVVSNDESTVEIVTVGTDIGLGVLKGDGVLELRDGRTLKATTVPEATCSDWKYQIAYRDGTTQVVVENKDGKVVEYCFAHGCWTMKSPGEWIDFIRLQREDKRTLLYSVSDTPAVTQPEFAPTCVEYNNHFFEMGKTVLVTGVRVGRCAQHVDNYYRTYYRLSQYKAHATAQFEAEVRDAVSTIAIELTYVTKRLKTFEDLDRQLTDEDARVVDDLLRDDADRSLRQVYVSAVNFHKDNVAPLVYAMLVCRLRDGEFGYWPDIRQDLLREKVNLADLFHILAAVRYRTALLERYTWLNEKCKPLGIAVGEKKKEPMDWGQERIQRLEAEAAEAEMRKRAVESPSYFRDFMLGVKEADPKLLEAKTALIERFLDQYLLSYPWPTPVVAE